MTAKTPLPAPERGRPAMPATAVTGAARAARAGMIPMPPGARALALACVLLLLLAAPAGAVPPAGPAETWAGCELVPLRMPHAGSVFHNMLERSRGQGTAWRQSRAWKACMARTAGLKGTALLKAVHAFWSVFPWKEDHAAFGQREWWATPAEFVRSGGGDCEDHAIIRYFALREHGVPASATRVLVLSCPGPEKGRHAVLEVSLGARRYILDSGFPVMTVSRFMRRGLILRRAYFEEEGVGSWTIYARRRSG